MNSVYTIPISPMVHTYPVVDLLLVRLKQTPTYFL